MNRSGAHAANRCHHRLLTGLIVSLIACVALCIGAGVALCGLNWYGEQVDGLAADNQYQLFSAPEGTVSTLLVSQTPFFLSSALSAFPQVDLQTAPSPQDIQAEGYDLYIFEGCLPESLPQDGALWLFS